MSKAIYYGVMDWFSRCDPFSRIVLSDFALLQFWIHEAQIGETQRDKVFVAEAVNLSGLCFFEYEALQARLA